MSKLKCNSIHEKAIRLREGGIVNVQGQRVRAIETKNFWQTCEVCDLDCLCCIGSEFYFVCKECDMIGDNYYYLKLVNKKR